jgi:hypothetical protein
VSRVIDDRDPLDYYIEVCRGCGGQLGPGVGSRTATGRCVHSDHGQYGGVVVRVIARHRSEQDDIARRLLGDVPAIPRASEPLVERDDFGNPT